MSEAPTIGYAERAEFYELECGDIPDRDFLFELTAPPVRSLLEVPCGVGRMSLQLARPGLRLVAVDLEPAMIRRLRQRSELAPRRAEIVARVGDLRDLALGERFERIVVQREAFQLLTSLRDAELALQSLVAHLAPGGLLMVDLAQFCRGRSLPGLQPDYFDPELEDGERVMEPVRTSRDGTELRRSRRQYRRDPQLQIIRFDYDVRRPDASSHAWVSEVRLRIYERKEFIELARQAGLAVEQIYGDYQRTPHGSDSVRMIVLLGHASERA